MHSCGATVRNGVYAQGYSVVEFFEAIQRKVDEERKDRASQP